jgi:hypothetical protein
MEVFAKGEELCQFAALVSTMPSGIMSAYGLAFQGFTDGVDSDEGTILTVLIVSVVVMVVIVIPLIHVIIVVPSLGCRNIVTAIRSFPSSVALEASKPVCRATDVDQGLAASLEPESSGVDELLIVGHVITSLLMVAGFIVICLLLLHHANLSSDDVCWLMWSTRRLSLGVQVLAQATMALMLPEAYAAVQMIGEDGLWTGWEWAPDIQLMGAKERFVEFQELSMSLYSGTDEIPALKDQFQEGDDVQIRDSCPPTEGPYQYNLYSCFGVQALTSQMEFWINGLRMEIT